MDSLYPLLIFGASLLLTVWAYRAIVNGMRTRLRELAVEEREIEERYLHLSRRKKQLDKELKELETQAILTQKDISAANYAMEMEEIGQDRKSQGISDEDTKRASEYMISKGLITIDQNERAMNKMEAMNMDFLGVCITLGYIDLETAKNVVKTLGIHHSTLSVVK
ncbi:hypothetical protein [Salidesulfovibrio brasiliensis]|uniref:hypothetical protein n=1 Tax=Salidesulfovibrio brasiliensis TaxID=221711 RepID=UPI0006D11882|nr:hypothetical protein [Salidesulfovibrio brasiliensis]